MQLIKEVADNVAGHRGVILNTQAAARLGIADGDPIEIATPQRAVRGRAVLRQGIRPDTLLLIGQFDHWATPFAKDFGVPSLNALATMSMDLTDATLVWLAESQGVLDIATLDRRDFGVYRTERGKALRNVLEAGPRKAPPRRKREAPDSVNRP